MKRRKIKATHVERVLFGDGKAFDLQNVISMKLDRGCKDLNVGCLNCWEHSQSLLTFSSAAQHEDIHVASWPPFFNYRTDSDGFFSLCKEGAQALSLVYAIHNSCFVLFSTAVITEEVYKKMGALIPMFEVNNGGCSAVFGPNGRKLNEDLDASVEGLVYANLDEKLTTSHKHSLTIVGHYSRPDLLSLVVHNPNEEVISYKVAKAPIIQDILLLHLLDHHAPQNHLSLLFLSQPLKNLSYGLLVVHI